MPIYCYKCSKCGKEFEFLQRMSEDPKKECPDCKDQTLEKQVTAAAFKIFGSCYNNDYKKKK